MNDLFISVYTVSAFICAHKSHYLANAGATNGSFFRQPLLAPYPMSFVALMGFSSLLPMLADHLLGDFWHKSHLHEHAYTFLGHKCALFHLDRAYTSQQYHNLLIKSGVVLFVHSDNDVVEVAIRTSTIL